MKQFYFIWPRFHTLPQHSTLSLLYSALCGAWHRWQQEGGMGAFSRFFAIVSCSSVTMTFLCPMERERCVDGLGCGGHLRHQSQWGHGGGRRGGEIVFCGRLFRTQLLWGFSNTKWQIHSIFAYRDARSVYTTFVYFFAWFFSNYPSLKHSLNVF